MCAGSSPFGLSTPTSLLQAGEASAPRRFGIEARRSPFLDGSPMLEVTTNFGAGETVEGIRRFCEAQAEEARKELRLSAEYRLTWLQDIPRGK